MNIRAIEEKGVMWRIMFKDGLEVTRASGP